MFPSNQPAILIVGPRAYCTYLVSPLKKLLDDVSKLSYQISTAEFISDVTEKNPNALFDCIIIVVDIREDNFSRELLNTLMRVPPVYLSSRSLLINGCSRSCNYKSAVELKRIASKFNICYLNAEIKDKSSCDYLLERIVNLIGSITGIFGTPSVLTTAASVMKDCLNNYEESF